MSNQEVKELVKEDLWKIGVPKIGVSLHPITHILIDRILEASSGETPSTPITDVNSGVCFPVLGADESATIRDGEDFFVVPDYLHGKKLKSVVGRVLIAGVDGTMMLQIRRNRGGVINNLLSVPLSFSSNVISSSYTINSSYEEVQVGDAIFTPDIISIHDSVSAVGLAVTLTFGEEE